MKDVKLKKRILLVDDEKTFLFLWKQVFIIDEDYGDKIDVFTTPSSEGVLAIVNEFEGKFDLVISDINRSGMNGLECMEQVHSKFSNIPFIFLTGYGSEEIKRYAIELGAKEIFSKPVDIIKFKEIVFEHLFHEHKIPDSNNKK